MQQENQAADEDMAPGHRGEDESPNKKQRVEHTVSHVIGDSEVEVLATNEEIETYIECDGTYWDEDDGEQLEPSQVQAGIEREVKQMRELDVAEVHRREEVPEGVRVWSGRWCHRKKAGGGAQPIRREAVPHRVVRGRLMRDPGLGGPFANFLEWRLSCVGR